MSGETIRIRLNGEESTYAPGLNARELVAEMGLGDRRFAVEINLQVVRAQDLEGIVLNDGDRIEVVSFVGGG